MHTNYFERSILTPEKNESDPICITADQRGHGRPGTIKNLLLPRNGLQRVDYGLQRIH